MRRRVRPSLRPHQRARRGLGTVVLAAALLVGCTGDDGDASDPDGTASGTEDPDRGGTEGTAGGGDGFAGDYRDAADRYADALAEVQEEGAADVAADPVGASEVYAELEAVTATVRDEVAALEPPDAAAGAVEGLLENLAAQLDSLEGAVTASEERDDRALQRHLEDYADRLAVWRDRHDDLLASLDEA